MTNGSNCGSPFQDSTGMKPLFAQGRQAGQNQKEDGEVLMQYGSDETRRDIDECWYPQLN